MKLSPQFPGQSKLAATSSTATPVLGDATGDTESDELRVLLLGGFGMRRRHLNAYCGVYRALGVSPMDAIALDVLTMTIPRQCDRFARRLLDRLERSNERLVIHLFSGAVWIYFALNAYASPALRARIVGVVFESTPLDSKPEQFGRFLSWKLGRNYRRYWSYPFYVYRTLVGISRKWESRNANRMLSVPSSTQVLFIYSHSDSIADAKYIERYIEQLRGKQVRVSALRLHEARHCLAIKDRKADYVAYLAGALGAIGKGTAPT
ncbi:MAG: TMEM53 family protein [Gammaproteobacteria bacterium]|nr:TMEM53 family protein [Gammaproteobacteria bacterium]